MFDSMVLSRRDVDKINGWMETEKTNKRFAYCTKRQWLLSQPIWIITIILTCVCVGWPLSLHGIPRACRTCTVIFRIGASYNSEISTLPYRPIVEEGDCGRFKSISDLSDAKSLVSKSGSCDKTTIHCNRAPNNAPQKRLENENVTH